MSNGAPKIDDRLLYILPVLIERIEKIKPELVIYEYPFNVKGNGRVLLEFIGVFRYHCIKNGIPYLPLQQQRIKKYATGKGNATKEMMVEVFKKETGVDLKDLIQPKRKLGGPTTDITDSYFLCKYLLHVNGFVK